MVETVASTTNFNLPVDEIIEEALDHLGGEHTSHYDARSARRSLNFLLIDLQNRGYPLCTMEQRTLNLVEDTASYTLDNDVLAIIDLNYYDATSDTEQQLMALSPFDYFNLTKKDQTGERPSVYAFDRTGMTAPKLYVWQVPQVSGSSIKYWCVRKHKDVTKSYQLVDISSRYLPSLAIGLAYFMAFKKEGIDPARVQTIFAEYERRLSAAFAEDEDRIDMKVYPDVSLK